MLRKKVTYSVLNNKNSIITCIIHILTRAKLNSHVFFKYLKKGRFAFTGYALNFNI